MDTFFRVLLILSLGAGSLVGLSGYSHRRDDRTERTIVVVACLVGLGLELGAML